MLRVGSLCVYSVPNVLTKGHTDLLYLIILGIAKYDFMLYYFL